MVATSASRVALSCEPTNISTFSSSMRRMADLVDSAGGPPASVGISWLDLPAKDAAGLVDLLSRELGRGFLGRAEQRGRAAQCGKQADLEFLRSGGRADRPGKAVNAAPAA